MPTSSANQSSSPTPAIPVVVLTGFLGAGKTTLLNHLLHQPGAQVGVVVNDFGNVNVDAGLVAGRVDEPVAISGGCICCLTDAGGLEETLVDMAAPRRGLDVIVVEASGLAEPVVLARLISRWGHGRFRLGGVVDVVDAPMHAQTVDTEHEPPLRYAATALVLVNKLDQVPEADRAAAMSAIRDRVHRRNPRALVVGTAFGRAEPDLLFDVGHRSGRASATGRSGAAPDAAAQSPDNENTTGPAAVSMQAELPIMEMLAEQFTAREEAMAAAAGPAIPHVHAESVSVTSAGPVDPGQVLDFCEDPPAGIYRIKAIVTIVEPGKRPQRFTVQSVGPNVYAARLPAPAPAHTQRAAGAADGDDQSNSLVAIGWGFDHDVVRGLVERALQPAPGQAPHAPRPAGGPSGRSRLEQYIRLHE